MAAARNLRGPVAWLREVVRRTPTAAATAVLITAAVATCGEPEGPEFDCSAEGRVELYARRIKPLMEQERPKSCNQCHLSGVDLTMFVKDTPCQTMACLVDEGLVDLDAPDQSMLLSWIDRAAPESDGITAQVLAEEREGMLQWIRESSTCGLCWEGDDPCTTGEKDEIWTDCEIYEELPDSYDIESDAGDCSDKTLEELFLNNFFPWRSRCYPCHFDGWEDKLPDSPKWIGIGDCQFASLETMRRVIGNGYIDRSQPSDSLWLLKPLDETVGGITHGGGGKIFSLDEDAYKAMLHWATRYSECNPPQ